MSDSILQRFVGQGVERLLEQDPELHAMLENEYRRQTDTLAMVASCSPADPSVLTCEGSFASNVTAEGYPGARYHAGCKYVDEFEQLAIDRAKAAFRACYANVQPHSATTANQTVMSKLLQPHDTILGMELDAGGHLTHGSKASISGQYFNALGYGLAADGQIDYEQVEELAREHEPKLIICGTTAYPRTIDFERFREIADSVSAWLLADITHIAGLVITGLHPSSIDHAHITTTCTHKQLYGPRGGLILMGRDWETPGPGDIPLYKLMQSGVFPFFQGAPIVNSIVAKARVLDIAMSPEFKARAERIVSNARALAAGLMTRGVTVVSGGTDNHIVLADVLSSFDVTGIVAQQALEECGIIVNKNRIPGDQKAMFVASGIRIGTNSLAARGLDDAALDDCADLIFGILTEVEGTGDRSYELDDAKKKAFAEEVLGICRAFPVPGYPSLTPAQAYGTP